MLALLLATALPAARADECDRLPAPSVTLKRQDDPVRTDSRYGYHSLTGLAYKLARPGHQVLGLTHGNAAVKVETRISSYTDPSGRWECASPQITITYGLQPLTVFVAREFPAGSCAYNEIYKHEMRHVKTYQDHLAAIEKDIADTLKRRFVTGTPWRGPAGQTRERVQAEMEERWIPYIEREIGKVEAAQARIDTAEEYERVAGSCGGEIRRQLLAVHQAGDEKRKQP